MTIPTLDVNANKVIKKLKEVKLCDGKGIPEPAFRWLALPQADTNKKINEILRGLSEWWSIAGNRRQITARIAYIIRYSIAKLYAAKFKKSVATIFKIGGNDLGKPIGEKAKSIVGKDVNRNKIKGILFDRYHKIPKPKGNKIKPNWTPDFVKEIKENAPDFVRKLWESKRANSKNPLAQMMWRLEK